MFDYQSGSDQLVKDLLAKLSDIHIRKESLRDSLMFPGPHKVDPVLVPYIEMLLSRFDLTRQIDATLQMDDGSFWRGHRDEGVVDGVWVRFRKMPSTPPKLDALPSPLPEWVRSALLEPESARGGLILITGATGMGKTTTASATVVSRLEKYAGVAYTVEQPPENPLNGWHGHGYCSQTWVKNDGERDPWARAMNSVLRSQPAGTPAILFLGEVREDEAARVAVQAANQGFLVVATAFASDIVSAVSTFANRVGAEARQAFALQLRTLVYQNIREGLLEVRMLRATPAVQQHIAEERYSSLAGELNTQTNQARIAMQQRMQQRA